MISEQFPAAAGMIGFRAKASIDESPEALVRVAQAVARAKEGDPEALRFLYIAFANNIYGYIRSIVQDDHEAEDLTQHVFAKLLTAIVKYDDRGVPFFAWLLRLARNLAIDHVRVNRPTPTDELYERHQASTHDLDRPQAIRTALQSLPDEQREVVFLRHVVGLTPSEIADRLGRSEGSIHGLHHRGRRALQRELVRLGSVPHTHSGARRPLQHAA